MKHIIVKTTQPARFPVVSVLVKACIILSTVALSLLLVSCPDEAQPHVQISLYTCQNGTAQTGTARTQEPTELCTQCNPGFILDNTNATCLPQSASSITTQVTLPPVESGITSIIVADFENPQALLDAGWIATGDFADPVNIDAWFGNSLPGIDNGAGFVGQRSFNSCQPGTGSACPEYGTLISPVIPVTHRYLNFLIAGTAFHADHLAVIIQDSEHDASDLDDPNNRIARIRPLYTAPGYITSDFDWRSIDLGSEMDEIDNSIRIIIRDEGRGGINVDHFFLSDQPWGLRQDQWSPPRPVFLGNPSTSIGRSTYIRLHTGGFDPAAGLPAALFGGFDDASTLSTDDGWEYSDGILAQDATAPAPAALAGVFENDSNRGRIGVNPISTCGITNPDCRRSTGVTITSPAFPVTGRYLNFLLSGGSGSTTPSVALNGADPSNTNIEFRLFAGDNTAATASEAVLRMSPQRCADSLYATSYGDERLWQSIDVSAYMNQTLRFQLIDNSDGGCQTINLDHMYFSDSPVSRGNIRATLPSASPDTTPPALITNLRAVQGDGGSVQVSWTEPFDSDLAHVLLSWEPADGDQTSPLMVDPGTRPDAITGLTAGTEYSFTAVSVDITGNMSAASQPSVVTVDATAPAAPTEFTARAAVDGGVLLSWTNPTTDTDFVYAVLEWEPTGGDQTQPLMVRGTSAVVTGLTHGTEYSFTIAGADIAGNVSDASAAQTATADSLVDPVTTLMTIPGDANIILTWIPPVDIDLASVNITWEPAEGTTTQPISAAAGTTAASITGLTNGTEYTISVVAVDTVGNRSTVETITATPAVQ